MPIIKGSPDKCIVGDCKSKPAAQCKGLCMKCYSTAKKLVTSGETTWEELYRMNLAVDESEPFVRAFNSKKDNK